MKYLGVLAAAIAVLFTGRLSVAQVVLVEPGHALRKIVDSAEPLDPSQTRLDTVAPDGGIESIGVNQSATALYVQIIDPFGSFQSLTTDIFQVDPTTGVVTPVALGTGFGINARGTDLHFDPSTGLLVTQDQNFAPAGRVATVDPGSGMIGTYSPVTPVPFPGATFGMQFSAGRGGSDVPAGDIVFTADVGANGIHSVTFGGATATTHVPDAALPGGGDDMVIQPNGDWIWVGDFAAGIIRFSPAAPHNNVPSALNLEGIFNDAGLPFIFGSRGTVCDTTGDVYVSYSGELGGSGIFRLDPGLSRATLLVTIGQAGETEGLHDLIVGRSSVSGSAFSLYFTVHNSATGGEQVWELGNVCAVAKPVPAVSPAGLIGSALALFGLGWLRSRARSRRR